MLYHIVGLESSFNLWKAVKHLCAKSTIEREFYLQEQLQFNKRETHQSLEAYVYKFKSICDELGAIGKPLPIEKKCFLLLYGLGSDYQMFTTMMLRHLADWVPLKLEFCVLRCLHKLLIRVRLHLLLKGIQIISLDHHSTRKISPLKIDDFSLQSSKKRQSKGKISHVNVDSPLLGIEINDFSSSKPKLKFQCQICHLFGHTADRFYKRFNKSSKTPSIHQALSALKLSDFDPKD